MQRLFVESSSHYYLYIPAVRDVFYASTLIAASARLLSPWDAFLDLRYPLRWAVRSISGSEESREIGAEERNIKEGENWKWTFFGKFLQGEDFQLWLLIFLLFKVCGRQAGTWRTGAVKNNPVYKSTSLTSFKSFILYSQTKQNSKKLSALIKYSPNCRALITERLQSDVFLPNTNEQSDYIVSTMDLLYWNYNGNHIFFHL